MIKKINAKKKTHFTKEKLVTKKNVKTKVKVAIDNKKTQYDSTYEKLKAFSISEIIVDETFNVRKNYDKVELQLLAESIKQYGQLQPVGISSKPEKNGKYKLIYGFRRFKAITENLERKFIWVNKVFGEKDFQTVNVIENIQREELNDQELAQAVNDLATKSKLNQNEIAKTLNKSLDWVKKKSQRYNLTKELDSITIENLPRIPDAHINATAKLNPEGREKIIRSLDQEIKSFGQVKTTVKKLQTQISEIEIQEMKPEIISQQIEMFGLDFSDEYLKYMMLKNECKSNFQKIYEFENEVYTIQSKIISLERNNYVISKQQMSLENFVILFSSNNIATPFHPEALCIDTDLEILQLDDSLISDKTGEKYLNLEGKKSPKHTTLEKLMSTDKKFFLVHDPESGTHSPIFKLYFRNDWYEQIKEEQVQES